MHTSPGGKHPEKQKQRLLSLSLPKTSQILSPELPFALHKRASVRSQLTAVTQDTQSIASDVLFDVVATKVNETDDDEDFSDVESRQPEKVASAFFIPGITGKARCLQSDAVARKASPVDELIDEKASIAESSRASTKRSGKSSRSRTSNGPSRSSSRCTSDERSNDESMDSADLLYDAVVDSIQARRKEGLTDVGEEEFQRMLSLLQCDTPEPSLRQQVTSIRRLLSDFERKELLKQRKSKKG